MHVSISTRTSYLKGLIKEANNTNELFQQVKEGLQQQGTSHNFEHYKLEDGILKYKNIVYIHNSENFKEFDFKINCMNVTTVIKRQ